MRVIRKGDEDILPDRFRQVDGFPSLNLFRKEGFRQVHMERERIETTHAGHLEIRLQTATDHHGLTDDFRVQIVVDRSRRLRMLRAQLEDVLHNVSAQIQSLFRDLSKVDSHRRLWDNRNVEGVMEPKLPGCGSEFNEIDPEFLLKAYQLGVFPMAMDDGEIAWFSPDPRGVIPLDTFHLPHGLKRVLKKNRFEVRINEAFLETMAGCAERPSTWIGPAIVRSYHRLFELGFAHSVETWKDGELVGGLYGVALGGAFFGESMFSRTADASKVALAHLVERMRARGFTLLDTQWSTPHLKQFGCVDIPRASYMRLLEKALCVNPAFAD
jgi:leucyl/phenylalanyl-tRNA--protein transferase